MAWRVSIPLRCTNSEEAFILRRRENRQDSKGNGPAHAGPFCMAGHERAAGLAGFMCLMSILDEPAIGAVVHGR